jgi:hydrogenase/urease accessory protein HupE
VASLANHDPILSAGIASPLLSLEPDVFKVEALALGLATTYESEFTICSLSPVAIVKFANIGTVLGFKARNLYENVHYRNVRAP